MNPTFRLLLVLAASTLAGCGASGPAPSANRSPLSTEDQARYEKALAQDAEIQAKGLEAERKLAKGRNLDQ